MKRFMRLSLARRAMVLTMLVALLAVPLAALADNLITDGDGLAPVVDTQSLNLGNVCTGTTVTKTVLHAIDGSGHTGVGTNVFANGAVVAVSITSVSGTGLSASGGGNITLPPDWVSQKNPTSSAVSSSITFVAGNTPRNFSGTVNYAASGLGGKNGDEIITRADSLNVTATVVSCDTTPPTLHLPANMTVEATSASGATVTFTATADDANPAHPAVTCTPASGSTFGFGTTTVNCSATDAAGNTANGSFTVTVQDTTPPAVTTPSNITAEAVDASGAVVTYSGQSAVDVVDGPLAATCTPASGSTFPLGANTVTCSATDSHGNTGTSTFTINVQDSTAPVLSLPGDITAEATGPTGAVVTFETSASDVVDGNVAVSCNWNSGDTFALGTTTVTCSATDSNHNTSSGSFDVIVQDTTPPALSLPDGFSVEATGPSGAVATFLASASDVVDGDVPVTCAPASGSTFALGLTTVNCSATDAAGNTGAGSFNVTVVDTTPPALTLPADQQLEATGPDGAAATFAATATDLVDGPLAVTCDADSGDTFPLGTTTISCSVSDAAGNTATGSFVIIVKDTTAPTITFVSRTPANSYGWNNDDVTLNWSCSDIVGVVASSVSQTVATEGADQSATGTCEDTSGNTASDTQTGINIDKTAPSVAATRTPAANAFGWNNVDVTVSFSGTDDRSGIDFCTADQVFGEGANQSASGTCTDKAGNVSASAAISNINVDKTAPTIFGAPDRAANANGWYNADVTVTFTCDDTLSGVDACTAPVVLAEGAAQSVDGTVADKAGNTASTTVAGINIDKTAPVLNAALDKTPDVSGWFNAATGAPTVSFTCSDALSGLAGVCPADHLFGEGADQAYSQTIYDLAGNSATAGVSGVDVDTVAPTIFGAPDRAANANGWYNADVTVTFTCDDTLSGVDACTAPVVLAEGAAQSVDGTVADKAGNTASTTVAGINIDKTAPVLNAALDKTPDVSGWFNAATGAPTVSFTCSDALSGLAGVCPADHLFGEGADQAYSQTIYDLAGNSATAGVSGVDVDTVAPTISASLSPVRPASGWWNIASGAPTVTYTCSDGTSGIASCPGAYIFGEGANQSHSGTAVDQAGNSASTGVSDVDVDLTAPTLSWIGGPADGGIYYFDFVPAAPTCAAADALSGPNGCAVVGWGDAIGSHTMTATAHDVAGNAYQEQRTYTVKSWALSGFFAPVDMGNVWNTAKNGSTVPLKFRIFAGPTELTDVSAVKSLAYKQIACTTLPGAPEEPVETLAATGGTVLRYDTTAQQFIFNWKTPTTAGKCYQVTMTAQDGSRLDAFFKLK